ncbi:response regulator receiver modulated metal dependent phosphohydrolase, partial [mine drainage metagenome]
TRQLSETYGITLAVLGDALELRDQDTMGHTERVVALSESIGRELGLSDDELTHLRWGAYVHDLGKIGVPDAVLRKPGPLTPDEWNLMQRHPEQGYHLLERLFFLSDALDVVRYHHERFDGKGYPLGLSGEEIPLLARIFAVADAYDAMTNDRPYRRAMS